MTPPAGQKAVDHVCGVIKPAPICNPTSGPAPGALSRVGSLGMEPTHTLTLTIDASVTIEKQRHTVDLVTSAEYFIERLRDLMGTTDDRYEWSKLFDTKGTPVAALTDVMQLTGVEVSRPDGTPLVQYLSATTDPETVGRQRDPT